MLDSLSLSSLWFFQSIVLSLTIVFINFGLMTCLLDVAQLFLFNILVIRLWLAGFF